MEVQKRDPPPVRAAWRDAEAGGAETPRGVGEAGPTAGNAHSAIGAVDAGARAFERGRTAQATERRHAGEAVLLGGMAVAFALLGVLVLLEVATFGAQFVG